MRGLDTRVFHTMVSVDKQYVGLFYSVLTLSCMKSPSSEMTAFQDARVPHSCQVHT